MTNQLIEIIAFYRFVKLPDYAEIRPKLLKFCNQQDLKGTILLAEEGINSTISGTKEAIAALLAYFDEDSRLANMPYKKHYDQSKPFQKMKVRLKKEIVRLGVENLNPLDAGDYLDAAAWDKMIAEPDVLVVDTRNIYEVAMGTFENAVNPMTEEFRQFPKWVEENLDKAKHKKVAMFCTGGIRCEKSTALLKDMGFEEVYHLKGGILQYLADTENKSGKWKGDCLVFDDRLAVNAQLQPIDKTHCPQCKKELTMDEIRWLTSGKKIGCEACGDPEHVEKKLRKRGMKQQLQAQMD